MFPNFPFSIFYKKMRRCKKKRIIFVCFGYYFYLVLFGFKSCTKSNRVQNQIAYKIKSRTKSNRVQNHYKTDCAFGYLRLIPPCNTNCLTVAEVAETAAAEVVATISILRENVITFFVVLFFWLGCRMNSPLAVFCMRSIRIDVAVTFTIRPYSNLPLHLNTQIVPMMALPGVDMR